MTAEGQRPRAAGIAGRPRSSSRSPYWYQPKLRAVANSSRQFRRRGGTRSFAEDADLPGVYPDQPAAELTAAGGTVP